MRQSLYFFLIFLVVFPSKVWAADMAAKDQAYELSPFNILTYCYLYLFRGLFRKVTH